MVEKSQAVSPALIFARPAADALWLGPTVESALGQLSKADPVRVLCGPPSSDIEDIRRHAETMACIVVEMYQEQCRASE
jgi:hypothetical protein